VHHQIYLTLVLSIHNTCKDQAIYYNWVISGDMFRQLNGHLQANLEQHCKGTIKIVAQLETHCLNTRSHHLLQ